MFQVLHSSAGAGKTHAVVKHYLGHCLSTENSSAYRQVLALTFTNKAAGEMKERVIHYLEDLARNEGNDARIRDLMEHLCQKAGVDEAVIATRAKACLKHMLHHWSEVAISTIDAFTRRVVQPFARDLRMDHDLRMTTEEEYYRELAVERLISEAGSDPRITEMLTETCLQLLHEERKWDPEKPLSELGRELSKENSVLPLEAMRSLRIEDIGPLAERLRTSASAFRQRVNALGGKALELITAAGVSVEDLAYGKSGIHSYYRKLCAFSDGWDPPGSNALKTLENGKWCSGKAGHGSISAMQGICADLERIFREAEELREKEYPAYVIRRAVSRELLPSFTLHELDLRLQELKQEDAVAFFSDLTRKVSEVVKEEPVPFIYERLGEKYKHFLIDEFQDTSMMQWNALLPLIDNALGTNGSALIVGDAKQAIYRWRNGEVRLFVNFPKLFGKDGDRPSEEREATLIRNFRKGEPLAHNHRSAGNIIEFNNNLFASLQQLIAPHLASVYSEHEQLVRKEGPGLVHIEKQGKEITGEERIAGVRQFTLKAIEDARADGFALGDIAILVRSKNMGRSIATHLIEKEYPVMSPDGAQLAGDPVIELLIELLRYLHTGDPVSAARVAQFQAIISSNKNSPTARPYPISEALPDPMKIMREWCLAKGDPHLRTTLTALIGELAMAHSLKPAEDAQILALLDEAHTWSVEHGQDIGGFLEHWERTGGQRSVEPPENSPAIQVMTIHKAKGLQFPVVIVPNACMSTKGDHGERIWIDPGEAVPELDIALVRNSKQLRELELPELVEESALSLLDSLDLLYVAFTRPEQRLYALVPEAGADAITRELLRFVEEHGAEDKLIDGERTGPWKAGAPPAMVPLQDVSSDTSNNTLILRLEAPDEWEPADPDPHRSHGKVIHELLAGVISAEDLPFAIERALRAGDLDQAMAGRLATQLGDLIASDAMRPYFGKGLKVRSECTIITMEGKALRPDRVVIEGGVVRVLDIKTGKPHPDHITQVQEYMRYLQELERKTAEGALFYVRDGSLCPVSLNETEIYRETIR